MGERKRYFREPESGSSLLTAGFLNTTVKPFVKICMRLRPLGASSGPKRAPAQAQIAARRVLSQSGCCSYPLSRDPCRDAPCRLVLPPPGGGEFQFNIRVRLKKTYEIPRMDWLAPDIAPYWFRSI